MESTPLLKAPAFIMASYTSSLSAVLAGTGGAASALAAELPAPGAFAFASPPELQNPAPDGITVVWAVNGLATGWVEYGESEALGQRSDGGVQGLMPLDDRVLKIRLTGLRPGTKYFYRVHACPITFKNAYDIRRGETITMPGGQLMRSGVAKSRRMRSTAWASGPRRASAAPGAVWHRRFGAKSASPAQ